MRTLSGAKLRPILLWLPATILIASCANMGSMNPGNLLGPSAAPPAFPAEQLVGRWGLAAYQRDEDRTRTESEARQQCRQAYEIQRGPGGGVLMHLADQPEPQELQLKGLSGGKTFIGPEGEAGGQQDREVVSFDGKILVLRWVDADVAARYGTAVYVKCEGTPPRTVKKKKKATKSAAKAPPRADPDANPAPNPNAPVFMPPPTQQQN
jgi:hypothetical protein